MRQLPIANTTVMPVAVVRQEALQHMPPAERKIIQSALSPQIRQLKPGIVLSDLVTILTTIYTIAGQKAEPETLAIYAEAFYSKLIESIPIVTIDEIKTALTKGVFEEYGEYYGLNVKTFISFVRSYLQSVSRKLAFEQHNKITNSLQESKPTPEEVEKSRIQFVNELYEEYLNGRLRVDFIPAYLYDFLLSKGMVNAELDRSRALLHYEHRINTDETRFLRPRNVYKEDTSKESALHSIACRFAIEDMFGKYQNEFKNTIFTD